MEKTLTLETLAIIKKAFAKDPHSNDMPTRGRVLRSNGIIPLPIESVSDDGQRRQFFVGHLDAGRIGTAILHGCDHQPEEQHYNDGGCNCNWLELLQRSWHSKVSIAQSRTAPLQLAAQWLGKGETLTEFQSLNREQPLCNFNASRVAAALQL